VHPYGVDRAAVEQDVWETKIPGLGDFFYATPEKGEWQPLLALNASDIATGCKVMLSQVDIHAPPSPTPASQPSPTPSSQPCRTHPWNTTGKPTALEAGAVDPAAFLDPAHCPDDAGSHNLTLAAASLMSARFPYVSPTGALTACLSGSPEQLFVADGGYLENTGLHTLLALWQDLEPLIEDLNATGRVDIVPVAVFVENHYVSAAVSEPDERPRELTGPPNADQKALLRSEPLEQMLAAEFEWQPGDKGLERHWFVVAPTTQPDVSAPLGWSLSKASRTALDCQIPEAIRKDRDENPCDATVPGEGVSDIDKLVSLLRSR
jgi:hypothetical protein